MKYKLGINTGFAVNRYSEPEEWVKICGETLGVKYVQLTADLLNPDLPAPLINRYVKNINQLSEKYGVQIISTFTGAFTRVNHMAHPDPDVREHWVKWFCKFADITADLGAESMGSHFGIFTHKDNQNKKVREERRQQNIENWHRVAEYSKSKGLKYLSWEPMSISREQGETLAESHRLQKDVNVNAPLPFYVNLDVDHGDVMSPNPEDTNPYAWLREFADVSPLVHLKQASKNKGGHWPFTQQHNEQGLIRPDRVIETLSQNGKKATFDTTYLLLELSFREREPTDSTVVEVLKESVEFWRPAVAN